MIQGNDKIITIALYWISILRISSNVPSIDTSLTCSVIPKYILCSVCRKLPYQLHSSILIRDIIFLQRKDDTQMTGRWQAILPCLHRVITSVSACVHDLLSVERDFVALCQYSVQLVIIENFLSRVKTRSFQVDPSWCQRVQRAVSSPYRQTQKIKQQLDRHFNIINHFLSHKTPHHPSKTTFNTIMFTKVISLTLLAVSAQGFAPIAPNSAATRPKTSLAFTVTIVKDGAENQTIECAPNTYILDAAELQGVQTPYSCRAGACSSCASLLIDGEIDQSGQLFLDDDKVDKGWLLSCVAYPKSDCTIKIDCEDEFYQS